MRKEQKDWVISGDLKNGTIIIIFYSTFASYIVVTFLSYLSPQTQWSESYWSTTFFPECAQLIWQGGM